MPPRKVVVVVHRFHPDFGGVEITAQVLAKGFSERFGDDVTVVTHTVEDDGTQFPFRVLREPGPWELLAAVRSADVVLHNNPCMRFWWPHVLVRTPLVIAVRQLVTLPGQRLSAVERVKYQAKYALIESADAIIANSPTIAEHMPSSLPPIPNSYRSSVFTIRDDPAGRDPHRLAFMGRLSADKGVDVLLEAVRAARATGCDLHLTVIGDGPERPAVERRVRELGLAGAVRLTGALPAEEAATVLQSCSIGVVPSVVPEAFGTVALELAACGLVVVGSDLGGLVHAVGPSGPLVPSGDAEALAETLVTLVRSPDRRDRYRRAAVAHVTEHHESHMVDRYREVLERVVGEQRGVLRGQVAAVARSVRSFGKRTL